MGRPFDEHSLLRNDALPGYRADDAAPVPVPSGDVRGLTDAVMPSGAVRAVGLVQKTACSGRRL